MDIFLKPPILFHNLNIDVVLGRFSIQGTFCKYRKSWAILTHFQLIFHFYTPWKLQKTEYFLMFFFFFFVGGGRYRTGTLVENGLFFYHFKTCQPYSTFLTTLLPSTENMSPTTLDTGRKLNVENT